MCMCVYVRVRAHGWEKGVLGPVVAKQWPDKTIQLGGLSNFYCKEHCCYATQGGLADT